MKTQANSLAEYAIAIVGQPDPLQKVELAHELGEKWRMRPFPVRPSDRELTIPDQPGRPQKPELLPTSQMPRRRIGTRKGLIALVHSLAHIELNAIDMAFDLVARFGHLDLPTPFLDGALQVGLDEACHFALIDHHLERLGARYGDLPAHGGLWSATQTTRHDLLARLAIVPLVLEARGLDVSPAMIKQVKAAGEQAVANSMETIYQDEINHVAFGAKWFKFICERQGDDPQLKFQFLVKKYFRGALKPPFNAKARTQAGLTPDFYESLTSI